MNMLSAGANNCMYLLSAPNLSEDGLKKSGVNGDIFIIINQYF